jgi:hypothetical protein
MNSILENLKILFTPKIWNQLNAYNAEVDEFLLETIEYETRITDIGDSTCDINGNKVWIGNYPYAFATINDFRASRKTILKFSEYLVKQKIKNNSTSNSYTSYESSYEDTTQEVQYVLALEDMNKKQAEFIELQKREISQLQNSSGSNQQSSSSIALFGKDFCSISKSALKKQYHFISQQNHPDVGRDVEKMKDINLAYEKMQKQAL